LIRKIFYPNAILLPVLIAGLLFTGCEAEEEPGPVTMSWGIPEEVTAFEGLQREPEGVKVEHLDEETLQVTWETGESYILPIMATSEEELTGVRYRGSGIPDHLEVEWLDPRAEEWHPLEEIPLDRVKAVIEEDNDQLLVDFGPPEGADFEEGMNRFIWFRLTPAVVDEFSFEIFGYQINADEPQEARVSNTIKLEAVVEER